MDIFSPLDNEEEGEVDEEQNSDILDIFSSSNDQ